MLNLLLRPGRTLQRSRSLGFVWRLCAAVFAAILVSDLSAQTIQLTSSAYSVNEDAGSIRIPVRRFGNLNTASSVVIQASGATAQDGQDFVARTATLNFKTNATEVFFDVVILDNDRTNDSKFINLRLSNPVGASLGNPSFAQIEILDDETGVAGIATGRLEFSSAVYAVTDYETEGLRAANALSWPGANITVVRKGGNRGRIQVDVATGLGTAFPGEMYIPITNRTLILNDYQMSTNFIVPIVQYVNFFSDLFANLCYASNDVNQLTNFCGVGTNPPVFGRIWSGLYPIYVGDANCPNLYFFSQTNNFSIFAAAPTWEVPIILSNPRLDPGEDTTLAPPTLGAVSSARLGIVHIDAIKDANGSPILDGLGFSFERAHYRTAEGAGGSPSGRSLSFYQMWVNRSACPDSVLVRYEVNNANSAAIGGDHLLRTFGLQAGSDYAHPFADYIPPGTVEWYRAMNLDPAGLDDGILRWSPVELDPKPLTIPIVPDDRVEFDEDLLVQLFQRPGDPGLIQPPALAPFGSIPETATLTIVFDNIRYINEDVFHVAYDTNGVFGAEQPAGAADRRYNRDGVVDIEPPFNPAPGANASVLAVAVTPDGRLLIGGEFESVNQKKTPWAFHLARMTRDGQLDTTFNIGNGPNAAVTAIDLQPDGKAVIGGLFSSYNGTLRSGLARVNTNGSLDTLFNPGLGANAPVRALKVMPDGKILIGGEFTSFNGTNVNYLARLNANGSLDTTFNVGGSGPDDFVYAITAKGDPITIDLKSLDVDQIRERIDTYDAGSNQGTVSIDYDFGGSPDEMRVYYNGIQIATTGVTVGRGTLTFGFGPGALDETFLTVHMNEGDPGLFGNAASWAYHMVILPNLDSLPVVGGRFAHYNGAVRNRVARLTADGGLDTTWDPGTGVENGIVFAVTKHGNKPVIAGVFDGINRVSRSNIAQLNQDGSVDLFFDPGTGFNDIVYTLVTQPTGKIVAGGLFTEFNTSRRIAMARLNHDGKLDTSFMDTAYNQFAGLPNPYTWMPENSINAMVNLRVTTTYTATMSVTNTTDNTVTNVSIVYPRTEDQLFIGGSFKQIGGGFRRDYMLPRNNFARVWGGSTPGPGTIGFEREQYTTDEDSGFVFVIANRDEGHLGNVTANFNTGDLPQGPGAATESIDYLFEGTTIIWPSARVSNNFPRQLSESYRGPNSSEYFATDQEPGHGLPGTNSIAPRLTSSLFVSINDDTAQEGDEQFDLTVSVDPTILLLGGEPIPLWPALGRSKARLTIIDNDYNPGVIGFAQTQYFVDENARKARITLSRTNGSAGRVTVDVRTKTPGTTASPGFDFTPINILTVVFSAGQTNAFFDVDIIDDTGAELDENIAMGLANPSGGATIGLGSAVLTIIDNDFAPGRLSFTASTNTVNEGAGVATVSIKRAGGSQGSAQVTVNTADFTAFAGTDYLGVTNLVLRWANGDTTERVVTIPIIDANVIDGTRRFKVVLSNPLVNGVAEPNALGNQKETIVDIIDNDAYGVLRFSQPAYVVDENGTNATITIIRLNGVTGDIAVGYTTTAELAIPGQDFTPVSGTLQFTNGQTSASFVIPILDDSVVDGSKTVNLAITGQTNNPSGSKQVVPLGFQTTSTLTIIDNELENIPAGTLDVTFLAEGANDFIYTIAQQPDAKWLIGGDFTSVNSVLRKRLARLEANGTLDATFFASDAPNDSVRSLVVQEDGRIVIAGAFTSIGGATRNYIARLVRDGTLDLTFDPGAGANNPIYATALQSDGKVLIGGAFSLYGPTIRNGVARLATNGVLDVTFNPGTGASGSPGFTVYALAAQLDGKILVGGDFTSFNSAPAGHLVRLKSDGSVDTAFDMTVGANDSIRSIVVQPDSRILIGGLFTQVKGVPANHIARLNPDGSVDTTFNSTIVVDAAKRGANGTVSAIAVQIDGKIVVGGDFLEYNGVTRRGITRLNSDGGNDPTINFGTGVNGSVAAAAVQPDRKIVIAGGFTEYDGQPRLHLARINGGSIKGSGRLEFASASFTVSESATNAIINVRRVGGTASAVTVHYKTQPDPSVPTDARAVPGVDYQDTEGDLTFPEGETQASFKVRVLNDTTVETDKIFAVALSNPTAPSGADQPGLGDQPEARVVITSDDSEISFSAPAYSVGESIPSNAASITVLRTGAISVPVSFDFYTTDGTATSGVDYVGATNRITFAVGESQRTIAIPVSNDLLIEGNETVHLVLANPGPGGTLKAGAATSTLTIVDDDFAPGEIRFERPTYSVREGNVFAEITVIRTNGLTGVVTVEYATSPGSATPDADYKDVSGILTFNDGVAVQVIKVQIFDDDFVENNDTINLQLSNVHGGASLGLANAVLTIIDDDLGAGSLDNAFNPGVGANGAIRAIEMDPSRRLLIGGDFTAFNADTNRSRIARLVLSGAIDSTFSTTNTPDNGVTSLFLQGDGRIVLGGVFNKVEGQQERRVARLLADGNLDTTFFLPLGLDGQVSSVAVQPGDNKVIIGGIFTVASAANVNHIARLNANGQVDTSFNPGTGADNNVNVVALQIDGKVLIGGAFNTVNGISAGRIARLNSNGSVDTSFRTGTGFSRGDGRAPMVYDILILASGQIMVVGDFTSYNGTPRAGIAVLDQNGNLQTFGSALNSVNGAIRAVAIQHTDLNNDEKVIIGGDFTFVDGTARPRVARLDAVGKFDPSFDPGDGADDSVLGIIVQPWDGRVIVVGAFTQFNNNPNLRGIARLNNDKKFLPTGSQDITLGAVSVLGSNLTISFTGEAGASFMIQGTSNFATWTDIKTVTGTGASATTTVPVSGAYQFYRIRKL